MDKLHTSGYIVSSFGLNFKIRASEVGWNLHKVKIYISEEGEDKQIGFFIIDIYTKTIYRGLRHGSLLTMLGINPSDEYNYEVHMHLIERHNLFIKKRFNKSSRTGSKDWLPTIKENPIKSSRAFIIRPTKHSKAMNKSPLL